MGMIKKTYFFLFIFYSLTINAQTPKEYLHKLTTTATSYQGLCSSFGEFLKQKEDDMSKFIEILEAQVNEYESCSESSAYSSSSEEESEEGSTCSSSSYDSESDEESQSNASSYSDSEESEEESTCSSSSYYSDSDEETLYSDSGSSEAINKYQIICILGATSKTLEEIPQILLLNNNYFIAARFAAAFSLKANYIAIAGEELDFTPKSRELIAAMDEIIVSLMDEGDSTNIAKTLLEKQQILNDIASHVKSIGARICNGNLIINLQKLDNT
jgi:hypothetical protein